MSEQPGYGYRGESEPQVNPHAPEAGQGRYFPPRSTSQQSQPPAQLPHAVGGIPQVPLPAEPDPNLYQQVPPARAGDPRPAEPPYQSVQPALEPSQSAENYPPADPGSLPRPATPYPASEQLSPRADSSAAAGDYDAPAAVYGTMPSNLPAPQNNRTYPQPQAVTPSGLTPSSSEAIASSTLNASSSGEAEGNSPQVTSSRRSPWWLLYGLVILVLIALVSWQIVRLSTGKVPSAVPLGSQAGTTETVAAPEPKPVSTTQTEQVKKVLAAQPVTPAQLGGDKKRVTFRSQSGIVVCTIAEKLEDGVPPLVPLAADGSGALASGSGVVCATASNFEAAGNVGKCKQGDLRLSVLGVWDSSSGIGGCVNGTTPLYQDVKSGQKDNSGKRFDLQPLGTGQYTQLGKYACTFGGTDATCVNVSTGKGFTFTDLEGYKFF